MDLLLVSLNYIYLLFLLEPTKITVLYKSWSILLPDFGKSYIIISNQLGTALTTLLNLQKIDFVDWFLLGFCINDPWNLNNLHGDFPRAPYSLLPFMSFPLSWKIPNPKKTRFLPYWTCTSKILENKPRINWARENPARAQTWFVEGVRVGNQVVQLGGRHSFCLLSFRFHFMLIHILAMQLLSSPFISFYFLSFHFHQCPFMSFSCPFVSIPCSCFLAISLISPHVFSFPVI